jgi:hypothetical protein
MCQFHPIDVNALSGACQGHRLPVSGHLHDNDLPTWLGPFIADNLSRWHSKHHKSKDVSDVISL